MAVLLPSLVIVGRPNVGKSTLFNRLTGTRRSIVTNEPGITRDRIYGKAEWRGRALEVVDTGGIVPDDKALIPQEILRQAHVAIKKAALLVLVVDSQAGLTPLDEELARLLRTTGKPFVIAVNKVDAMSQESSAAVFHRIGVPIFPIAAEHGTGVDDLLDAALAQVSVVASVEEEKQPEVIEVAIIGRPNVGKSTLLNRMVGEERSIVSPIPGTTMDNVDTEITREGRDYRFVDTAGIRRKGKTTLVAEKLSVVMARRGLERCDVALLVVDGEQGVTQGDAQIASYAEESGRSVVIVINKWDLAVVAARDAASRDAATAKGKSKRAPGERHKPENFDSGRLMVDYEKMIRAKLKFLSYAPIVFLSAKSAHQSMLGSAPPPHRHAGPQQLAQGRSRPAARHHAEGPPGAHLLHHAGENRAAHVPHLHQPESAAALQLSALPRKRASRQVRFPRHARPLHPASSQARYEIIRRRRRP